MLIKLARDRQFWSHPARGAWIEICQDVSYGGIIQSHPARGAWIEISAFRAVSRCYLVAPRKGCVD